MRQKNDPKRTTTVLYPPARRAPKKTNILRGHQNQCRTTAQPRYTQGLPTGKITEEPTKPSFLKGTTRWPLPKRHLEYEYYISTTVSYRTIEDNHLHQALKNGNYTRSRAKTHHKK